MGNRVVEQTMELFDRQYWGYGVLNRFKDDWLVTRQAAKLFFASTICVLALTPVFLGKIDPHRCLTG
jgi:hypothetical protein